MKPGDAVRARILADDAERVWKTLKKQADSGWLERHETHLSEDAALIAAGLRLLAGNAAEDKPAAQSADAEGLGP